MKGMIGLLAGGLFLTASSIDAEAARVRFWGGVIITNTGPGCTNGSETNTKFGVRFKPSGVGDGANATMSLFRMDSAINLEVPGAFNSTFKTAKTTEIFDYASEPIPQFKIKFTAQSPATITATTPSVTATGQILGWDGQANCVLTFRMAVTKRIEN